MLLEEKMTEAGMLDGRDRLVAEIDQEIAETFAFAKISPFPTDSDWKRLNYSTVSPLADKLLRDVEAGDFDHGQAETIPGPY